MFGNGLMMPAVDIWRHRLENMPRLLDEARQRYQTESDFRFVIDSFLGRFDELMRDVTPGDHGSSVIRTIMSSNEGKAYTLLCAAVGRIH